MAGQVGGEVAGAAAQGGVEERRRGGGGGGRARGPAEGADERGHGREVEGGVGEGEVGRARDGQPVAGRGAQVKHPGQASGVTLGLPPAARVDAGGEGQRRLAEGPGRGVAGEAVDVDDGVEAGVLADRQEGGRAAQGVPGGGGVAGVDAAPQRAGELAAVEAAKLGEGEAEVGGPDRGPAGRLAVVVARVVVARSRVGMVRPSSRTTAAES